MLCENCGKKEANVRYEENINGRVRTLNLCEECSKKLGIMNKMDCNISTNFPSFFGSFLEDFEELNSMPIFNELKDVSFEERINIMVRKANNMNLKGVDYFSYLIQLQKILFTPLERQENIEICMLANNLDNEFKKSEIIAIITINFNGFSNNENFNLYYILKSNGVLMPVLKEEIEGLFFVKKIEYIDEFLGRIPGVGFVSKETLTPELALNRFLQRI